jgi:hypothetical protein
VSVYDMSVVLVATHQPVMTDKWKNVMILFGTINSRRRLVKVTLSPDTRFCYVMLSVILTLRNRSRLGALRGGVHGASAPKCATHVDVELKGSVVREVCALHTFKQFQRIFGGAQSCQLELMQDALRNCRSLLEGCGVADLALLQSSAAGVGARAGTLACEGCRNAR